MFSWLKRSKPLHKMDVRELMIQERTLDIDKSQLLKKSTSLSKQKADLFQEGVKEKNPELRQVLAQRFEAITAEQLMLGRELTTCTKEAMTISRMRVIRSRGSRSIPRITSRDMAVLSKLIDDDSITNEAYQSKLDEILAVGREADIASQDNEVGKEVLDMWDRIDSGLENDPSKAFDQVDQKVRRKQKAEG